MAIPVIDDALGRIRAFRSRWNDGDIVDDASGLTAEDLDLIIHQAAGTAGEVAVEDIDPAALRDFVPDPTPR